MGVAPQPHHFKKWANTYAKKDRKLANYKQVKVNLLPDDYAKMDALAKQYDMSIASLFRELADMQIDNPPTRKGGVKSKSTDPELLYHLAKIGNNLNQIASRCNVKKIVDRLAYIELVEIKKQLSTLLLPTAQKEEVGK